MAYRPNLLSIDLGFGETKGTNGTREVSIPSVVGEARQLLTSDIVDPNPIHNLTYIDHLNRLFVGELAINQSSFKFFSLKESKADDEYAQVLFRTMLALLTDAPSTTINLVTGLPVTFYFEQKESLEKFLSKPHHITLQSNASYSGSSNGTTLTRDVTIHSTKIVPQPLGSLMHWLLQEDLSIHPEHKYLASGTIGIIDIGFYTTDYLVLNNLQILQDYSRSTRSGIALALKSLTNAGIDLPLYVLSKAIRNGQYRDAKAVAFNALAKQIQSEIQTYWPNKLDIILVTGGGGIALYDYLELPKAILVKDASIANAKGYYKIGRRSM